jgi:hypothetical protein
MPFYLAFSNKKYDTVGLLVVGGGHHDHIYTYSSITYSHYTANGITKFFKVAYLLKYSSTTYAFSLSLRLE